jgi:hypothetical protein
VGNKSPGSPVNKTVLRFVFEREEHKMFGIYRKLPLLMAVGLSLAAPAMAQEQGLFGAVSPGSRSVQVGQDTTAFATLINSSAVSASNCKIAQAGAPVGSFSFQTTDSLTNTPTGFVNNSVNIPAGGSQSFVFTIAPNAVLNGTSLLLAFSCDGFADAPVFPGVNTLTLSASSVPVPDVIAITATQNADQIVDIAGLGRFAAYSAAAVNIGVSGNFAVRAEYTGSDGPLTTLICETNASTGACLVGPSASVQSAIAQNSTSTYAVFATRAGDLPFAPASNRIRLRFTDANSLIAGETGIAARGTGTDLVVGPYVPTADGFAVNGVAYSNGASTYTRVLQAGVLATSTVLARGQQVRVIGTKADGEADTVAIAGELVKGPITALSATEFEVAGQPILFGDDTVFEDRVLSAYELGDFVEIDGVFDANGAIVASRVDFIAGGFAKAEKIEVTGIVANLNSDVKSFTIQNLNVDYASARVDDGFAGGNFANGDLVEVKSTQDLNGLAMTASKVEPALDAERDRDGEPGFEVELEGFIDRFVSVDDFDINGRAVATNAQTVFRGGSAADLGLNVKVEAEGVVDDNNVLQANKISIKAAKTIRLEGAVDAVDTAEQTITLLGLVVSVGGNPDISDDSQSQSAGFGTDNIQIGDWLRVRGSLHGDAILASEIRKKDARTRESVQGPVSSFDADARTLHIMGILIRTSAATVYQGSSDAVISAEEFFSGLSANDLRSLVKAKGVLDDTGVLQASELSLEPEGD